MCNNCLMAFKIYFNQNTLAIHKWFLITKRELNDNCEKHWEFLTIGMKVGHSMLPRKEEIGWGDVKEIKRGITKKRYHEEMISQRGRRERLGSWAYQSNKGNRWKMGSYKGW